MESTNVLVKWSNGDLTWLNKNRCVLSVLNQQDSVMLQSKTTLSLKVTHCYTMEVAKPMWAWEFYWLASRVDQAQEKEAL